MGCYSGAATRLGIRRRQRDSECLQATHEISCAILCTASPAVTYIVCGASGDEGGALSGLGRFC